MDYCGFMWYRYRYVSRDHTANMEVSAAPGACSRVRQFVPKHQMLSVSTDLVHLPTFLPTDPPTCTRRFVRPVTNSSIAPSVHPSTQIYARAHTHRDTLHMRPCTNACVNPFPRADQPFDLVSVIHTHTHTCRFQYLDTWHSCTRIGPKSVNHVWHFSLEQSLPSCSWLAIVGYSSVSESVRCFLWTSNKQNTFGPLAIRVALLLWTPGTWLYLQLQSSSALEPASQGQSGMCISWNDHSSPFACKANASVMKIGLFLSSSCGTFPATWQHISSVTWFESAKWNKLASN